MTNLSHIITAYSVCEFIEHILENKQNLNNKIVKFSEECELLGGNCVLFTEIAHRELEACGLLEQEGGVVSAPAANSVAAGGIAGMKPEDLAVPVKVQKKYTSENSMFKRKKPNKYYMDKNNRY